MNNRQRVINTLAHVQTDRVPTLLYARSEVERELVDYYSVDTFKDVLRLLGADTYAHLVLDVVFPGFAEKTNGRLEGDCPGAGNDYIFHDSRTFEDPWGVVRRVGSDGKYVQWITGPLADARDPDEFDFAPIIERPQLTYRREGRRHIVDSAELTGHLTDYKEKDLYTLTVVAQPFKTAWYLRGLENLLADYLINRPFVERLYDRIFQIAGDILRRATAAGVDMIGFEGDIAMQDRLIMGPEPWRAVDKPRLAALIASCKAINPDVHVYIHSDGDLTAIMPDLIEIGIDVFDPIQPECMDPVDIKRQYGDRITLHGCGSLQRTLPFGTPEDCRQEVRHLIDTCSRDGGLILRVSNAIGFDVPVENVVAWYETARDYTLE